MPDYPLGVLIKHIQIQIGKSLNHRLEQMNITGSQAHVLVFLMNRTGQRTTLRDLEEHLQQSHVTVTGLVQLLTLTPKATSTLKVIHAHLQCTEEQLVQGFTPEERELLQQLLLKAAQNMAAPLPPPDDGTDDSPQDMSPDGQAPDIGLRYFIDRP